VVAAASTEPAQFYVFSFTDTPIVEAAQDVVDGALALDLSVDPAVEGTVNFRADGWYAPDALLQDFGDALLDQDIALMRTAPGAYAVMPRSNMPLALARGAVLMATPAPPASRPPGTTAAATATTPGVVYGRARWWDGAFEALLIFFAGAVAGGAALFGGQIVLRRADQAQARLASPLLRLSDQRALRPDAPSGDVGDAGSSIDADLVIPRFVPGPHP